MSVSPQVMLEQLRQVQGPLPEQSQPELNQAAIAGSSPTQALETLRTQKQDTGLWKDLSGARKEIMRSMVHRFTPEGQRERAMTKLGEAEAAKQGIREVGQGVLQMGFSILDKTVLPGAEKAYTKMTDEQRAEFNAEFKAKFGDDIRFGIAKTAGKVLPVILLTRNPQGLTPTGQIAATTTAGVTVGAIEYIPEDSEESRLMNAAKAGGFSFALATLFNALPVLRNFFKSRLGVGTETKFTKEGLALAKRTGVDLKLSQITGDPIAESLERIAQTATKGERASRLFTQNQVNKTFRFWRRAAKTFAPGQKNFGEKLQKAFDASLGNANKGTGLLGARAKQAKFDFTAVDKASGGKANIPLSNFFSKVDDLISEGTSRAAKPSQVRIAKELTKLKDKFENGKATAMELQNFLQTYGAAAKGRGSVFSQAVEQADKLGPSKALFKALVDDLDTAAKGAGQAAKLLKTARNNYALNTDAINALEKTAVKKLFTGKIPASNDELQQAIVSMKSDKLGPMMKTLSKVDPELEQGLRRFWIEHHLSKAIKTGEATQARFNPEKMLALRDSDAFKAIFNTAESRKLASDGISIVRRVIMNNFELQGRLAPHITQAAGVAASRDRTFVARLAADLFAPRAIAKYVETKRGVTALSQMAKARRTNEIAVALIQLNNISGEDSNE